MADRVQRFAYTNLIQAAASTVTGDSERVAGPLAWLDNPLPSKSWRSGVGWRVSAKNNKINYSEGAAACVATVATGAYQTGDEMATAVQTAINAAAPANTYAVLYDAGTKKFTIARSTGVATFSLLWATGLNREYGCGVDLGFNVAADDTGATTYTGDYACYQSRHWLDLDAGSALSAGFFALLNNNVSGSGTATVYGHTSAVNGLAPITYSVTHALSGTTDLICAWASPQETYRYWRIVISDVTNPLGYAEVGIAYVGPYWQPGRSIAQGYKERSDDRSEVMISDTGGIFVNRRPVAKVRTVRFSRLSRADRDTLASFAESPGIGSCLFVGLDPPNYAASETLYGAIVNVIEQTQSVGDGTPPDRYTVDLQLREAQ